MSGCGRSLELAPLPLHSRETRHFRVSPVECDALHTNIFLRGRQPATAPRPSSLVSGAVYRSAPFVRLRGSQGALRGLLGPRCSLRRLPNPYKIWQTHYHPVNTRGVGMPPRGPRAARPLRPRLPEYTQSTTHPPGSATPSALRVCAPRPAYPAPCLPAPPRHVHTQLRTHTPPGPAYPCALASATRTQAPVHSTPRICGTPVCRTRA